MADEIEKFTENVIIGDLMFILGLGIPLHSLDSLNRVAKVLAPIAIRLPFSTEIFDLELLDHFIVGKEKTLSFSQRS